MSRIMIVDDDVEWSENIAAFLKHEGHTVETLDTIAGALAKLSAFRPDLLVLDMMFPENPLGGLELAGQVRHDPGLQRLPIILLTGVNEHFPLTFPSDPKEDCRPIQDFLEKPVELQDLLRSVREALGLR